VRALTFVNLVLWVVLFAAWVPYTLATGWMDPTGVEVQWILTITAAMQVGLFGLRKVRRRPVLG
jgi:hypothetical protein